jgi:hypothetical protein
MKFFRHVAKRSSKPTPLKANLLRFETLETRRLMSANQPLGGGTPPTSGAHAPDYSSGVVSAGSVFAHQLRFASKPDAPATLYLDFDGHFQVERVGMDEYQDWLVPGDHGWDHISTTPFDRDNDPNRYSPDEQEKIQTIWASVAEDYAPFNINVTTINPDPGSFNPEGPYMRMVITGGSDFRSGYSDGGFAEYGAYANPDGANTGYAFGRSNSGGHNSIRFIAETISHEAGHAFGLDHFPKHYGNSDIAPIMRENSADGAERGIWWDDDMDIIASSDNGFGYRPDDHVNEFGGATWLQTGATPGLYGSGVIENRYDRDMFRFEVSGGNLSINVKRPQGARFENVGNLDPVLRLYDSTGFIWAYGTEEELASSINLNVPAGMYYVRVASQRANVGDVGQYTLKVTETAGPQIVAQQYYQIEPNLMGFLVTFNEPILSGTFTTHDVGVTNGARVNSVTLTSSVLNQFLIKITPPAKLATFSISIGPQISDRFGNLMDQNRDGTNGTLADVFRWTSLTNAKTKTASAPVTTPVTTPETAKSGKAVKRR